MGIRLALEAEMLEQFRRLYRQADRQVFGGVELFPVALLHEMANLVFELRDRTGLVVGAQDTSLKSNRLADENRGRI